MPTYEYRCPQGHEFEEFQKMSDPPEADCPVCGEAGERRLSGGAGVLFRGEGFYATDYRSPEYRKKAAAESEGGSGDPGSAQARGGDSSGKETGGAGDAGTGSGSGSGDSGS